MKQIIAGYTGTAEHLSWLLHLLDRPKVEEEKSKTNLPKKEEDEEIITVTSALGVRMGTFLWHKDDLEVIRELSRKSKHSYIIIGNGIIK